MNRSRTSRSVAASSALLLIFMPLLCTPLAAEATVAFCGIVSRDVEGSMVKMTEDLYYTQLGSIDGVKVIDRRKSGFASAYLSSGEPDFSSVPETSVFYALIRKGADDKWTCALCMAQGNDVRRVDKTYDSYYKILMENKAALLASFKMLLSGEGTVATYDDTVGKGEETGDEGNSPSPPRPSVSSTDSLAGTWIGEDGVEKAVILRGGRGFIIFSNGATMNIKVETDDESRVVITQAGRSNASFFPELPRQVALNAAATAEPIVWTLAFDEDGMLTGEKRTLVAGGKGAEVGNVTVTWRRKV